MTTTGQFHSITTDYTHSTSDSEVLLSLNI